MKTRKIFVLVVVLALLSTATMAAGRPASVNVQILSVNDFHGALDPSLTKPVSGDNTTWYYRGGAEYLTKFVQAAVATNPNTIKISAGDMIGASPLLSALYHDEPTIMAFNLMGFDFNTTGNHEFDEGWNELLRMQNGGCHPVDGCYPGVPAFTGASFHYLSANVIRIDDGHTLFASTEVRKINGVKIGFIGVALETTPTIVTSTAVEGLIFNAEVATINRYTRNLRNQGVRAIVVILHNGAAAGPTINSCPTDDPFLSNVVKKLHPEVDVVLTGHTHNAYICEVKVKKNYAPIIVTGAGYNGRYLTDIDLTIAGTNGQVIARAANNIPVETPYLAAVPDPTMKALLDQYRTASAPLANRIVGTITADIKRGANMDESALGDVIADAQLAATIAPDDGAAVIAMTNPGGIRTDLLYAQISGGELAGEVTYAEAFAVQPFSNSLVTLTLTGDQLKAVLEQQATAGSDGSGRMLQISYSLTYTWSLSAPVGSKVSDMKVNGVPVDPSASYRVTINNFLAGGGDGFTAFLAGTDPLTGMIDLDAFVAYLTANSPVAPGPQNRITKVP